MGNKRKASRNVRAPILGRVFRSWFSRAHRTAPIICLYAITVPATRTSRTLSVARPGLDRCPERLGYFGSDVVLHLQNVVPWPVVAFRPDNVPVVRTNQACGDA